MPEINTLREALTDELRDILHAEKQITKALPKMMKKASSEELKAAFEKHLAETEEQITRLEECFELLGENAKPKVCEAMKGIIEEANEELGEDMTDEVRDAILIACAQKVEHYEIASYGTVIAWAESLGLDDVCELLKTTLDEEKSTDESLNELSGEINAIAAAGAEDEDEEGGDEDDDDEDEDEEGEEQNLRASGGSRESGSGREASGSTRGGSRSASSGTARKTSRRSEGRA